MNLSGNKQKWARETLPQRKTERRTFSAWGMIISFLRVLSDQLSAKKFMFYLKQRKAGQIIHTQKCNKAGNILRKMIYILNLILKWKQVKQSSSRHISWVKETALKTVIQGVLLLSNSYLKNVCLYVITVFLESYSRNWIMNFYWKPIYYITQLWQPESQATNWAFIKICWVAAKSVLLRLSMSDFRCHEGSKRHGRKISTFAKTEYTRNRAGRANNLPHLYSCHSQKHQIYSRIISKNQQKSELQLIFPRRNKEG